jgi:hypothetical protein
MNDPALTHLPEQHTDFVFSTDLVLWGLLRWVAVVAVVAALFFLRRWLRRLDARGVEREKAAARGQDDSQAH